MTPDPGAAPVSLNSLPDLLDELESIIGGYETAGTGECEQLDAERAAVRGKIVALCASGSAQSLAALPEAPESYTIWMVTAPFNKHGVPLMGRSGASARRVVVMDGDTFKRLIAEHPSLATAQFRTGELDG
jgi:hypothetical protein